MNDRRRRSPRFDALETRQVLSAATAAHAAAAAQTSANQPTPSAYLAADSQKDTHGAGKTEILKTTYSGSSNNEGAATATSTELARNNHLISVKVVLQTAHGQVRLAFGPNDVTQNTSSSSGSEITANYHITSGTGVFAREKGTGTVSFWTYGANSGWNLTITPSTPSA